MGTLKHKLYKLNKRFQSIVLIKVKKNIELKTMLIS